MQDTGYSLQAIGYRVQDTSYRLQATLRLQGAGYRLQGAGYRLQGAGCRLQIASYKLQIASYRLTDCSLQVAGCQDSHGRTHLKQRSLACPPGSGYCHSWLRRNLSQLTCHLVRRRETDFSRLWLNIHLYGRHTKEGRRLADAWSVAR